MREQYLKSLLASLLLMVLICAVNTACTQKMLDKQINLVLMENPKSLDPARSSDVLAAEAMGPVYETLLQYHYLKRPYTLVPLLAEKIPEISKDGLTVTVKIKKGVRFQDDPSFKGNKGRELTSADFVYGIKRLADPRVESDGWWLFDGKILGLNEWRGKASTTGHADYSEIVEGLQTPDPYTLIFKMKKKFPQILYALAMVYTAPVAWEAVEHYGPEFMWHPVGTGAFVISRFTRDSEIIYEKNANYHGEKFPSKDEVDGDTAADGGDFDFGKDLPLADKITVHIFKEESPSWLQFLAGQVDLIRLPKDSYTQAIEKVSVGRDQTRDELKTDLKNKGMGLTKNPSTTEWFITFNLDDPILGQNKLLRKAMALAYDSRKEVELFTNGLGLPSNQILPPSIAGFDVDIPKREMDLKKAKELLAKAGNPDGLGLPHFTFEVEGSSRQRQLGEFFKSQMAQIGIQIDVRVNTRPELFARRSKGQIQLHMDGWVADYPDAENFMQLLYGPNHPPGSNNAAFNNKEFDSLFETMASQEPSSTRQKTIKRMTKIFLDESPWIPDWISTLYYVHQGWLKNYKYSDFSYNNYKYYRLDLDKKKALKQKF